MRSKRIIIATNFSESAKNAATKAIALFGLKNVEYVLLNCYSMPSTGVDMLISLTDLLRLESEEGLANECDRLLAFYPELDSQLEVHSVHGHLPRVLNKMFKKDSFDVVVIGKTESTEFERIMIGSNSDSLVHSLTAPVLLMPKSYRQLNHDELRVGIDSDDLNATEVMAQISNLLDHDKRKISFVLRGEEYEIAIDESKSVGSVGSVVSAGRKPMESLIDFAKEYHLDVLAFQADRRGFFDQLLGKDETHNLMMMSKVPLLIFPEIH